MSQNVRGLRLEDLEIKPHLITKLKGAGIESIFDLAISIPHQLIEDGSILTGSDAQVALDIVMKAKRALIDSEFLAKDFSTADQAHIELHVRLCRHNCSKAIPSLSERRRNDEKTFKLDAICCCRNTLAGKIDN
jgi:hypothetical protein